MKKALALMMALVMLLSAVQIALAKEEVAYTGTIAGGSLHMRKEPSPSGKVIQTYKSGTKVDILENDGTWCKVQIGKKTGYMMAQYLKIEANYPHLGWGKTQNDGTILNFYERPDAESKIIDKQLSGMALELVEKSGDWYRVRTGNFFAYVKANLISPQDGEFVPGLSGNPQSAVTAASLANEKKDIGNPLSFTGDAGAAFEMDIHYPDLDFPAADEMISAWIRDIRTLFEADHQANHANESAKLTVEYSTKKLDDRYSSVTLLAEYTVSDMHVQQILCLNLDEQTENVLTGEALFSDTTRVLFSLESKIGALMSAPTDGYSGAPEGDWLAHTALARDGVEVYLPAGLHLPAGLGTQKITIPYAQVAETMRLDSAEISQYVRVIDPTKPMIALTFDDGPSEETIRILDVLAEYNGRATFCIMGNRVETYGDIIKRAIAEGNEIASHTWNHRKLTEISSDSVRSQLTRTSDAVRELTGGYEIRVLRPPYGSTNKSVRNICKELNLVIAHWKVDTLDWETRSSSKTYRAIMKGAKNGAIILCHDLYSSTASAVEKAVPELVAQGYQLVTVSELLSFHKEGAQPGTVYAYLDPENIDTDK